MSTWNRLAMKTLGRPHLCPKISPDTQPSALGWVIGYESWSHMGSTMRRFIHYEKIIQIQTDEICLHSRSCCALSTQRGPCKPRHRQITSAAPNATPIHHPTFFISFVAKFLVRRWIYRNSEGWVSREFELPDILGQKAWGSDGGAMAMPLGRSSIASARNF
jgi:hypothetical protein